jgi:heat shock protein HslJ
MKKEIVLMIIVLVMMSCKTASTTSKEVVKTEPTPAYKQQMENLEQGIYFRGTGNEPEWSLKISEKTIEFTSLKPGFESLSGNHLEPIRVMDANVKMYRVATESGTMNIQIMQQECVNTMSGEKFPYSVRIEITKNNNSTNLSGCGIYITDPRLHDIWVLEKLNGKTVSTTDFIKEVPNLEINSSSNNFLGFAGCNRMNGTIFFERELLRFTNIITTRMACPGNNKESEFLKALQSATSYKVENMRLILSNPSGEKMVFKKVD